MTGHTAGRRIGAALLAVALALALAGCGKKGELEQPDGAKPTYPKTYPTR